MKSHPGHTRIKPSGAEHLKMTGMQGERRLGHFKELLHDAHQEALHTKTPEAQEEASKLARDVRDLRRAYQAQHRKQYKLGE